MGKSIFAMMIALAVTICLVGCSKKETPPAEPTSEEEVATPESTEAMPMEEMEGTATKAMEEGAEKVEEGTEEMEEGAGEMMEKGGEEMKEQGAEMMEEGAKTTEEKTGEMTEKTGEMMEQGAQKVEETTETKPAEEAKPEQ